MALKRSRRYAHDVTSGEPFQKIPLFEDRFRLVSNIDHHIHTSESDGRRTPKQRAKEIHQKNGMTAVICDHHTPYGAILTLEELDALKKKNASDSRVIAGIELGAQASIKGADKPLHIHVLGISIDPQDPTLKEWLRLLKKGFKGDILGYMELRDSLVKRGYESGEESIRPQGYPERPLVRNLDAKDGIPEKKTDIMRYLIDRLFQTENNRSLAADFFQIRDFETMRPKKAKRILSARIGTFTKTKYFGGKDQSLTQVSRIIKGCGGLTVVAHIGTAIDDIDKKDTESLTEIMGQLGGMGADGIEAYTPKHKIGTADRIANAARNAGLLITCGSDSHDIDRPLGDIGYFGE